MMKYKSYSASIEFDEEAEIFHGEVEGIRAVVTFQAKSAPELKHAFHDSIDDYLTWCTEDGREPDKPFSGKFPVRASSELHRDAFMTAKASGKTFNHWVIDQIRRGVEDETDNLNQVK